MKQTRVPIGSLYTDPACMVRASLNQEAIDEYCEAYLDDAELPPLEVFKQDTGKYLIADGWHRYEAAKKAKLKTLPVKVFKGEHDKVVAVALDGNKAHGLRRTREDKRICAEMAIETWPKESNVQLAKRASVSESFIRQLKAKLPLSDTLDPRLNDRQNLPSDEETPVKPHISQPTADVPRGTKPSEPADETGYKLTAACLPFWERRQEVQDLLTLISRVKTAMEKAIGGDDKDQLYWNVNNTIISDLTKAYTSLTNAKPFAVCPDCKGKPKGCRYCGETGLLCKWAWDKTEQKKKDRRV